MITNTNLTAEAVALKSEHMRDYLRGFGRPRGQSLLALIAYNAWPAAARDALDARCSRILDLFDDETLALIADGDISVPDVAASVARELGAL